MIAGLLALTLTAVTAAGIAVHNAANAQPGKHAIALSRQLAAESLNIDPADPVTARRLAVAAWRVFPTDQAGSAMTTLLTEQQQNGILPADPSGVNGVAFSPDGKLLASAGADGTVRLWNPATGQAVGTPLHDRSGPQGGVSGWRSARTASCWPAPAATGTVRLWDPVTGQPVGTTLQAAASRPRRRVRGGVQPGRQAAGQRRRRRHGAVVGSGHRPARRHAPPDRHPADGVFGVAFSPDGKLLASAGSDGHGAAVGSGHRPGSRTLPSDRLPAPSSVYGVAFSPDGKLLASAGGDGTVRLWNPATGQPVGAPLQHRPAPRAACSRWRSARTASCWPAPTATARSGCGTRPPASPSAHPSSATSSQVGVYGVAFSPDGKLLASAGADGTVRLWDPVTGQPVAHSSRHRRPRRRDGVAFSPDGKLLASAGGDGTVRLWDPVTGQPVGTPSNHRPRTAA